MGEQQAVEVPVEQLGVRLTEPALDPLGVIPEQPIGDEPQLAAIAHDSVGDQQCAGVANQQRVSSGQIAPTSRASMPGATSSPKPKLPDLGASLELVQPLL